MNNKYLKKCIAVILSGATYAGVMCPAAFAEPDDITAITVTATATADNAFLVNERNLVVESDTAENYGYDDELEDGVSALDVLVKMHEVKYGEAFTPDTAEEYLRLSGGWVMKSFGSSDSIGYAINRAYVGGLGEMSDGDSLEVFFYQDSYWMDLYAHIDDFIAIKGKKVTLNASGWMYMMGYDDPEPEPLYDVCLAYVNEDGTLTDIENARSDENGDITVTFNETGKYYITLTGEDCDYEAPVIPSITEVTVLPSPEDAYNALTKKYAESGLTYGDEWVALGMARGGTAVNDAYYKSVMDAVHTGGLSISDAARTILALTAMGKRVDKSLFDTFASYEAVSNQYCTVIANILLALDSNGYNLPQNSDNSRDKMIELLVSAINDDTLYIYGVDSAAMVLPALAPYCSDEDVQSAVDKAFEKIDSLDTTAPIDPCTYAQGIIAYTAYGKDPSDWILKLMEAYDEDENCFNSIYNYAGSNTLSTEQSYYALAAYLRYVNGNNTFYDMTTDAFYRMTSDDNADVTHIIIYSPFDNVTADMIDANYKDGALDSVAITPVTLKRGSNSFPCTARGKIMLWDSVNGMEPLCEAK